MVYKGQDKNTIFSLYLYWKSENMKTPPPPLPNRHKSKHLLWVKRKPDSKATVVKTPSVKQVLTVFALCENKVTELNLSETDVFVLSN